MPREREKFSYTVKSSVLCTREDLPLVLMGNAEGSKESYQGQERSPSQYHSRQETLKNIPKAMFMQDPD